MREALRRYARGRRPGRVTAAVAVFAAAYVWTGTTTISAPTSTGSASIGFRFLWVMAIACLVVTSTASPLQVFDRQDSGPLRRMLRRHLAVGFLGGAAVVSAAGALSGGGTWDVLRAYATWASAALVTARAVSPEVAWASPVVGTVAIIYFGYPSGDAARWNWVDAPVDEPVAWVVATVVASAAVVVTLWPGPRTWSRGRGRNGARTAPWSTRRAGAVRALLLNPAGCALPSLRRPGARGTGSSRRSRGS